jgi:hypothetical protein
MPRIALDTQLLLLLLAGETGCRLDHGSPRLKQYRAVDYQLLVEVLVGQSYVTIPNVLTEVSNLIGREFKDDFNDRMRRALGAFVARADESYVPSLEAVGRPEYRWLGLTDAAWLCCNEPASTLWTDDQMLYIAATELGLKCRNFTHLRAERGHL